MKVNGEDFDRITDIWSGETLLTSDGYWTIERNGQQMDLPVPEGFLNKLNDENFQDKFLTLRFPFFIGRLADDTEAPLELNDVITSIDSINITYYDELRPLVGQYAGQTVAFGIERNGQQMSIDVPVRADSTIGFWPGSIVETSKDEYTFGEAVTRGTSRAFGMVVLNARALGKMFSGEVSARSLSGPIGIVNMFPKTWDWNAFWYTTGFISMILAFMNLLPIPALDGGHVVFLLFEMISGRAPSDQFLENAQKVGMIILLALMVFVFGNDILKLFGL